MIESSSRYPNTYEIPDDSDLYKLLSEGSFRDGIKSFDNPLPTIIRDNENKPIIVFTYCENTEDDTENLFPVVYFYDIQEQKEIARASGASIFLYHEAVPFSSETEIFLYCDQNLAELNIEVPEDQDLSNGIFKYLEPRLES